MKIFYAFIRKIQTPSLIKPPQISRSTAIFQLKFRSKLAPGFTRGFFYSLNAPVKEPKYVGVAFALFAKGMTAYFGLFLTVC